jgi:hypothetical protein
VRPIRPEDITLPATQPIDITAYLADLDDDSPDPIES